MILSQFILTLLATVLFCLGWSIVTDNGNVLHFIRKYFEASIDNIEYYTQQLKVAQKFNEKNVKLIRYIKFSLFRNKCIYYFGKPFVLCITCYSSLWGVSVFAALNGVSGTLLPYLIINSFAAAFLNTLIYKLYEKL